ncbi:MAG: ATP-binding protein [Akkermansiaceae bacterium]|nr:ATP-binding protein [Akkermansiaceae bacterium]
MKSVIIENYGPYRDFAIDFRFDDENCPIPLVVIGKNGSGKSILLAHLVNSLVNAKQHAYEDSDIEKGMVYKLRTPLYFFACRIGKTSLFNLIARSVADACPRRPAGSLWLAISLRSVPGVRRHAQPPQAHASPRHGVGSLPPRRRSRVPRGLRKEQSPSQAHGFRRHCPALPLGLPRMDREQASRRPGSGRPPAHRIQNLPGSRRADVPALRRPLPLRQSL